MNTVTKPSRFVTDVLQELKVLKDIGVRVPKKAFALAESTGDEYADMSVSEAADLIIQLS